MTDVPTKRGRGPDKKPRKRPTITGLDLRLISIRLPVEVVEYFGGSTTKMRDALMRYIKDNETI